jgi:hypothetical protein
MGVLLILLVRLTPAFAAGLKRSGKPVRQHALVYAQHGHELMR